MSETPILNQDSKISYVPALTLSQLSFECFKRGGFHKEINEWQFYNYSHYVIKFSEFLAGGPFQAELKEHFVPELATLAKVFSNNKIHIATYRT